MKPYIDFLFEKKVIIKKMEILECQILLKY